MLVIILLMMLSLTLEWIQGLPADWYWHSANDNMAEGSNVKAVGRYMCLTTLHWLNINSKQNLILKLMDIF